MSRVNQRPFSTSCPILSERRSACRKAARPPVCLDHEGGVRRGPRWRQCRPNDYRHDVRIGGGFGVDDRPHAVKLPHADPLAWAMARSQPASECGIKPGALVGLHPDGVEPGDGDAPSAPCARLARLARLHEHRTRTSTEVFTMTVRAFTIPIRDPGAHTSAGGGGGGHYPVSVLLRGRGQANNS